MKDKEPILLPLFSVPFSKMKDKEPIFTSTKIESTYLCIYIKFIMEVVVKKNLLQRPQTFIEVLFFFLKEYSCVGDEVLAAAAGCRRDLLRAKLNLVDTILFSLFSSNL